MIRASAPARIDLAGGTIDVWPVCLALDGPAVTVNVAIDLRARVEAQPTGDGHVEVVSEDRAETLRLPVGGLRHDRLGLATRLIEHYGAGDGLRLRLRAQAPPQSGLGGSSSMAVAIAGALARLRGVDLDLRAVQDVETALLRVPTGYQDYVPARHGGVHVLFARAGGARRRRIRGAEAFLGRHLLLADTRLEHRSGMNNWEVVKRFLDGDARTRACCERIRRCAELMGDAVERHDLEAVAEALDEEWRARRELAPVVSNAKIEALAAAAREAGALAAKVCGAGGGGCMALVVRDAADGAIAQAIERAGGRMVDFRPDADGLRIE